MKNARKVFGVLLILLGLALCGHIIFNRLYRPEPVLTPPAAETDPTAAPPPSQSLPGTPAPSGEPPPEEETAPALTEEPPPDEEEKGEAQLGQLPEGKLVITKERKSYQDGNLNLSIPVINVERSIFNGTDKQTLNKGVGLYEYAQLPGEGNRNVSLAGHRNGLSNGVITDRAPFFYIDTLQEGDYLYIYNKETIYRYLWEYSEIVKPDNWDPIRTAGYSCLTITSCHPIGISDHRIVVRARLDEIIPYDKNYPFPGSQEEASE